MFWLQSSYYVIDHPSHLILLKQRKKVFMLFGDGVSSKLEILVLYCLLAQTVRASSRPSVKFLSIYLFFLKVHLWIF
jgi:hypothetical protein